MSKVRNYTEPFMPIDPDYTEIIEEYVESKKKGKVNFFDEHGKIESTSEGLALELLNRPEGVFLAMTEGEMVRVER